MQLSDLTEEARIAVVAQLVAVGENPPTQTEIAESLKISQTAVSRLLNKAREKKWLAERVELAPRNFTASDQEAHRDAKSFLYRGIGADTLRSYCKNEVLRHVTVIRRDPQAGKDASDADLVKAFGKGAVRKVMELARSADKIGVAWGKRLHSLVVALEKLSLGAPRSAKPIEFVPVCGDPLGEIAEVSSTRLTARLHDIFNGPSTAQQSLYALTGVPAFVPVKFLPKELKTVEKLLRTLEDYNAIFPPWKTSSSAKSGYRILELDMLLTAVGSAKSALGYSRDRLVKFAGIERTELERRVVGDIGGILIPAPGPANVARVEKWSKFWTGMKREHLSAMVDRVGHDQPGIVVLAQSADRVKIVLELVHLGLIHELIIDDSLSDALRAELAKR